MFLALDQGTTSSRSLLFSETGTVLAKAQEEFPQIFPQPGWVEHDPEAIWQSQLATARRALSEAGVRANEVRAIGIANQRETVVMWDRLTGKPIGPAIVWQDRRTTDKCDHLRQEGWTDTIHAKTGLEIDPYFSATKLGWMFGRLPQRQWADVLVGTVDSYLVYRLTRGAVHATDPSNASRTLLYDIHRQHWDEELCRLFGVPMEALPEARSSDATFGETDPEWFGGAIPIRAVLGDQQAATFGQGCEQPGQVKNTYGTGSFLLAHTGERAVDSKHRLLTTIAWQRGDRTEFALEGSVFVAGSVVQWLRDGLGVIGAAPEVEALAASVPDSGGVCFVPAFVGLGAPYWDAEATGLIVGLTRGTTKAHIARAALEAVAHQTCDVVDSMNADCETPLRELRVDGGMTDNGLLMQVQADLLGVPVRRATLSETTAFGVARMAGMDGQPAFDRTYNPQASENRRQSERARWKEAVARARSSNSG